MKRTNRLFLLFVIVGLTASVAFAQDDKLSGKWYGDNSSAKFAKTGSSYEGIWNSQFEMTSINFDGKNVSWRYSYDIKGLEDRGTAKVYCEAKFVVGDLVGKCTTSFTLPKDSWTETKTFTLEKQ